MSTGTPTWRQNCHELAPRFDRRLSPLAPEAVDRGRDDEDHQRDLEVEVDDLDPRLREEGEAVVVRVEAELVGEELRHDPDRAEGGDERERERDAREVRRDARERRERRAHEPRRAVADRGVRDQKAEQAAEEGRDEAHLDAVLVGAAVRLLEERPDVVERPAALGSSLKAPTSTFAAGRNRNAIGRRGTARRRATRAEGPRRPAFAGRAGTSVLVAVARGYAADLLGHSVAIMLFALCAGPGSRTSPSRRRRRRERRRAEPSGRPCARPCR